MPATADDALPDGGGVYEYVDETPHIYQFADGTVITPQRGDVCTLPYLPDRSGRWEPSKKKVTRLPDNHPDQAAATRKAAADARAQVLAAPAPTTATDATAQPAADTGKAAS